MNHGLKELSNVVRFPVERRRLPTMRLVHKMAPLPEDIDLVVEVLGLTSTRRGISQDAELWSGEVIGRRLERLPIAQHGKMLDVALEAFVRRAVEACLACEVIGEAAAAVRIAEWARRGDDGKGETGKQADAASRARTAAGLLLAAHRHCEEAFGVERTVGLALRRLAGQGHAAAPIRGLRGAVPGIIFGQAISSIRGVDAALAPNEQPRRLVASPWRVAGGKDHF